MYNSNNPSYDDEVNAAQVDDKQAVDLEGSMEAPPTTDGAPKLGERATQLLSQTKSSAQLLYRNKSEAWHSKTPEERKKYSILIGVGALAVIGIVAGIASAASGSSSSTTPTGPPTPGPPGGIPGDFEIGDDGFSNRGGCAVEPVVVKTQGYTGGREYPSLAAIMSNDNSYEHFLPKAIEVAFEKVEASISPVGTLRGSVVAAITGTCPDYKATWARDQALTFSVIVDQYEHVEDMETRKRFESYLKDYAHHSHQIYLLNPGLELGEPKFNLDGTKFSGAWCRPQTDGPATRAMVLMRFAIRYMDLYGDEGRKWVQDNLYPKGTEYLNLAKDIKAPIKRDLDYMVHNWDVQGDCEIWEEVHGRHFYDRLFARRALINGANFAKLMNDPIEEELFNSKVSETDKVLTTQHWDDVHKTVITGFEQHNGEEAAIRIDDIQTTLAIAHSYAHEDGHWHVTDPRSIANAFYTISAAFNYDRFTINVMGWKDEPELGVALGRYTQNYPEAKLGDYWGGEHGADGCAQNFHLPPEVCPLVIRRDDGFCPGQPWFLATNGMSEFLWEVLIEFQIAGEITVDNLTRGLYKFYGGGHITNKVAVGSSKTFTKGTKEYNQLMTLLIHAADSFIKRSRYHMGENYRMDEQYNGFTGIQSSAGDLTWSYASLITAVDHRRRLKPRSLIESFTPEGKVEIQVFVSYLSTSDEDVKVVVGDGDCSTGVSATMTRQQIAHDVAEWSAFISVDANSELTLTSCANGVKSSLPVTITTNSKSPLNALYLRHKELSNKCDMIDLKVGPPANSVKISFTVDSVPGDPELVYVTGEGEELGNWDPCGSPQKLAKVSTGVYSGTIYLSLGEKKFKFTTCDGGTGVFEERPDRQYVVTAATQVSLSWDDTVVEP